MGRGSERLASGRARQGNRDDKREGGGTPRRTGSLYLVLKLPHPTSVLSALTAEPRGYPSGCRLWPACLLAPNGMRAPTEPCDGEEEEIESAPKCSGAVSAHEHALIRVLPSENLCDDRRV